MKKLIKLVVMAMIVLGVSCSKDANKKGQFDGNASNETQARGIIEWQQSLGGNSTDWAKSIQQTSDGGYIVAGFSESTDGDVTGHHEGGMFGTDYWIVKLTKTGDTSWQKCLGGSDDDYANSIQQTSDGGYIVAGFSGSDDGDVTGHHGDKGNADSWIVKLTKTGAISWQKSLGGSGVDGAKSIQQTSDGGYIVAGSNDSDDGDVTGHHGDKGNADFWIVKLTKTGAISWQKSLGGSGVDGAESIQQTSDGGYIVAGGNESFDGDVTGTHGGYNCWIVKLTKIGNISWQKSLGGSGYDVANSIQQTSDGGYIVAGESNSDDGDVIGHHGDSSHEDSWIVKLTKTGAISWQKSLGGSGVDGAKSIQQTSDGGYIVAGKSYSDDGDVTGHHGDSSHEDSWIVKLTKTGAISWQKSLGGSGMDEAYSIQQTSDGGYIVAGDSDSDDGDVTGHHGNKDNVDSWIVKFQ